MSNHEECYSIVCPICQAAITGKCLEPTRDGQKYRAEPHQARVDLVARLAKMKKGEL